MRQLLLRAAALRFALAGLVLSALLGPLPALAGPSKGFSAFAVDAYSGKVLIDLNGDVQRYPASITKVMTLYIMFQEMQAGRLSRSSRLTVSAHASNQSPSKLGLKPGDTISVDDAIKGVVTRSANDAAVAIAENISGSEAAFAERMTRTARALGMTRTQYRNASGLPNPGQVSTARDIATLSLRIQRDFPQYYPYFRIASFTYKGKVIGTHNKLLGRFAGTDGIKTGYIGASGFNLTTSAARGDRRLVGVVLGGASGPARDRYMMAMLDSLFAKVPSSPRKQIALLAGTPPGLTTQVAAASPVFAPVGTMSKPPKPAARPSVVLADVSEPDDAASNDGPSEDDAEDGVTAAAGDPNSQPEFDQAGVALVAQAAQEDPAAVKLQAQQETASAAVESMPSTSVSVTPGTTTVTKAEPAPVRTTVPFSVKVASADSFQGPAGADETIFPVANSSGKGDNLLQPDPATTDSKSALKKPVMASLAGASAAAAAEAETISPASDPAPEAAQDVAPARKSVANSGWNIQIGASPSEDGANSLISKAKKLRIAALSGKPSFMLEAARGKERIYRARFSGFTEKTARAACRQLSRKGLDCLAVQPDT